VLFGTISDTFRCMKDAWHQFLNREQITVPEGPEGLRVWAKLVAIVGDEDPEILAAVLSSMPESVAEGLRRLAAGEKSTVGPLEALTRWKTPTVG